MTTFVTVSAIGLATGSVLPNDGASFGPDTPGTTTSGIQEALNAISPGGGMVFIRKGNYAVSSYLKGTGSNQTVWFEPGVVLTFAITTVPLYLSYLGPIALISIASNIPCGPPFENYSHVHWFGNGCTINANGAGLSNSTNVFCIVQAGLFNSPSPILPGGDFILDGFVLQGIPNSSFFVAVLNYTGNPSTASYRNLISNVRISRIHATWASNVTGCSGFVIQGGVRQLVIEDSYFDNSNIPNNVNYSTLFIRSASGETQQVTVRRSIFIATKNQSPGNPGAGGEVIELQGNGSQVANNNGWNCHELFLEDCVFDSSQSSPQYQPGGAYIDDADHAVNTGFIYNVEFKRCYFRNVIIGYKSNGSKFGYLRLVDGSPVGGVNGGNSLPGRYPHDSGVSASITSGVYQNLDGFDEDVIVAGGSGTSPYVAVNGANTGQAGGIFRLRTGDKLTFVNFTTTNPTLMKQSR